MNHSRFVIINKRFIAWIFRDTRSKVSVTIFSTWHKFLFKSHLFSYVHKNIKMYKYLRSIHNHVITGTKIIAWSKIKARKFHRFWLQFGQHLMQACIYRLTCKQANSYLHVTRGYNGQDLKLDASPTYFAPLRDPTWKASALRNSGYSVSVKIHWPGRRGSFVTNTTQKYNRRISVYLTSGLYRWN